MNKEYKKSLTAIGCLFAGFILWMMFWTSVGLVAGRLIMGVR